MAHAPSYNNTIFLYRVVIAIKRHKLTIYTTVHPSATVILGCKETRTLRNYAMRFSGVLMEIAVITAISISKTLTPFPSPEIGRYGRKWNIRENSSITSQQLHKVESNSCQLRVHAAERPLIWPPANYPKRSPRVCAASTLGALGSWRVPKDAKRRAVCMIHSRLTAYGKLCKNFSVERRFTGRKYRLPKKLSKRTLIKVGTLGDYTIHENIEQGAILVTQKD